MKNQSFTLIELLVVIAVIGMLSSIVLVSMRGAREKARIAKAQSEIRQLVTAMYLYKDNHGELPPIGDNCSACSNPCNSSWTAVIDALVSDGLLGSRIDKDPWGNYYCYDDNDNVCCGCNSPLYSMGPNGVNEGLGGDDIGIRLPECDPGSCSTCH
jgi:general secretion pathway protein G